MAHFMKQLSPQLSLKAASVQNPPDTSLRDHELIQQTRAGQTQAFAVLYEAHRRGVFSVCLRMLRGDEALAEDLTQDAFLRAFRRLDSFRGDCAFRTWLRTIAVNGVLMHFRARKLRTTQISFDELNRGEEDWAYEKVGSEDKQLASAVDRVTLSEAINQLPPGYRITFLLLDVEGYTHDEAAKMLGCSIGNTKSQLHRARLKMRELLAGRMRHAAAIVPTSSRNAA